MTPGDLKKLLPRGADDGMATHIINACERTGLPLSYGLAMIEKESGFRNIFGHDPTTSIPNSWKGSRVTRLKYTYYKLRRAKRGMQGVGPAQLTYYTFQDQADRLGGCWKPEPNMVVAFRLLKTLTDKHGKQAGAALYNGIGTAAAAYGRDFVRRQLAWHKRVI